MDRKTTNFLFVLQIDKEEDDDNNLGNESAIETVETLENREERDTGSSDNNGGK